MHTVDSLQVPVQLTCFHPSVHPTIFTFVVLVRDVREETQDGIPVHHGTCTPSHSMASIETEVAELHVFGLDLEETQATMQT